MCEKVIFVRNKTVRFLYKRLARPLFFLTNPERIHDQMIFFGRILGANFLTRWITRLFFGYSNKALEQKVMGIKFKNPIGLGGGFDKNGRLTKLYTGLGFGFAEIGSVTGEECYGNPKPRIWRLRKAEGIIVNMGLKNDGAEKIFQRLKKKEFKIPIAVNMAKTNCKETAEMEKGISDYKKVYRHFETIGAFDVINISCPNAYGGEPFTDAKKLDKLLSEITKIKSEKPMLIKLPPDLPFEKIDKLIEIAEKYSVDGFVCTNLTKDLKKIEVKGEKVGHPGGVSGRPVRDLADRMIKHVYKKTGGKKVIIGVGGVFSAEDAYKKVKLGASLVELITGMIFEGPQVISEINQGLVKLLKRDGYKNISEAIGRENT